MEFKLAVTVTAVFDAKVPLAGEMVNQAEVFTSDQLNEVTPKLEREKFWLAGLNGPPYTPEELKLANGVICNASGGTRVFIKFCPIGVPQPVQRS